MLLKWTASEAEKRRRQLAALKRARPTEGSQDTSRCDGPSGRACTVARLAADAARYAWLTVASKEEKEKGMLEDMERAAAAEKQAKKRKKYTYKNKTKPLKSKSGGSGATESATSAKTKRTAAAKKTAAKVTAAKKTAIIKAKATKTKVAKKKSKAASSSAASDGSARAMEDDNEVIDEELKEFREIQKVRLRERRKRGQKHTNPDSWYVEPSLKAELDEILPRVRTAFDSGNWEYVICTMLSPVLAFVRYRWNKAPVKSRQAWSSRSRTLRSFVDYAPDNACGAGGGAGRNGTSTNSSSSPPSLWDDFADEANTDAYSIDASMLGGDATSIALLRAIISIWTPHAMFEISAAVCEALLNAGCFRRAQRTARALIRLFNNKMINADVSRQGAKTRALPSGSSDEDAASSSSADTSSSAAAAASSSSSSSSSMDSSAASSSPLLLPSTAPSTGRYAVGYGPPPMHYATGKSVRARVSVVMFRLREIAVLAMLKQQKVYDFGADLSDAIDERVRAAQISRGSSSSASAGDAVVVAASDARAGEEGVGVLATPRPLLPFDVARATRVSAYFQRERSLDMSALCILSQEMITSLRVDTNSSASCPDDAASLRAWRLINGVMFTADSGAGVTRWHSLEKFLLRHHVKIMALHERSEATRAGRDADAAEEAVLAKLPSGPNKTSTSAGLSEAQKCWKQGQNYYSSVMVRRCLSVFTRERERVCVCVCVCVCVLTRMILPPLSPRTRWQTITI